MQSLSPLLNAAAKRVAKVPDGLKFNGMLLSPSQPLDNNIWVIVYFYVLLALAILVFQVSVSGRLSYLSLR